MTAFIKACPNCSYEINLEGETIDLDAMIQCPSCYETVGRPLYFFMMDKLEDLEATQ